MASFRKTSVIRADVSDVSDVFRSPYTSFIRSILSSSHRQEAREAGKIPLGFLRLYSYNYSDMAKLINRDAETGSKTNMKKTTIELTEEQYFFLKEKALELQKQNQNASIVSIIRDLIEKDRQEWKKGKRESKETKTV
jgi:hypothetical protein